MLSRIRKHHPKTIAKEPPDSTNYRTIRQIRPACDLGEAPVDFVPSIYGGDMETKIDTIETQKKGGCGYTRVHKKGFFRQSSSTVAMTMTTDSMTTPPIKTMKPVPKPKPPQKLKAQLRSQPQQIPMPMPLPKPSFSIPDTLQDVQKSLPLVCNPIVTSTPSPIRKHIETPKQQQNHQTPQSQQSPKTPLPVTKQEQQVSQSPIMPQQKRQVVETPPIPVVRPSSVYKFEIFHSSPQSQSQTQSNLWIEKYRPKNLRDVIGNTKSLEELHKWVKLRKEHDNDTPFAVFIHGPPGIGKTTVAHLILQNHGFTPIEINASDVRTKNALYSQVYQICTRKSPLDKKLALIVDEIDGASSETENSGVQGLIDFLVECEQCRNPSKQPRKRRKTTTGDNDDSGNLDVTELLQTPKRMEQGFVSHTTDSKDSKNTDLKTTDSKNTESLVAPIICIANDVSSASIRRLQTHCKVFRFYTPWRASDMNPLIQKIAKNEGISLLPSEIKALAEGSKGDFRHLINMLQMISNSKQGSGTKTMFTIQSGDHDLYSDIFSATKSIFANALLPMDQILRLMSLDSFLMPLMIQENYLRVLSIVPETAFSDFKPAKDQEASLALAALYSSSQKSQTTKNDDIITKKRLLIDTINTADLLSVIDLFDTKYADDYSEFLGGFGTRVLTKLERPYFPAGKTKNTSLQVNFPQYLGKYSTIRASKNAMQHTIGSIRSSGCILVKSIIETPEVLDLFEYYSQTQQQQQDDYDPKIRLDEEDWKFIEKFKTAFHDPNKPNNPNHPNKTKQESYKPKKKLQTSVYIGPETLPKRPQPVRNSVEVGF